MFELWRKTRKLDKTRKFYDTEIRKAKKEKRSPDKIDELVSEMFVEEELLEEEVKLLVTHHWVRKAEKLFLPVPSLGEDHMWEKGNLISRWYLTNKGITTLRNLIREEIAARHKVFLEWANPLIGIIGAITGLLGVLAVILAMN